MAVSVEGCTKCASLQPRHRATCRAGIEMVLFYSGKTSRRAPAPSAVLLAVSMLSFRVHGVLVADLCTVQAFLQQQRKQC